VIDILLDENFPRISNAGGASSKFQRMKFDVGCAVVYVHDPGRVGRS
jgi:hypothetical protein